MMIYKRIFIVLAALSIIVGCQNTEPIAFDIDTSEILIGPDGGVRTIKVTSPDKWVATTNVPWITVSPANGVGTAECKVLVDSALIDSREAIVRITTVKDDSRKDFKIIQDGYDYSLTVDNDNVEVPSYADYGDRNFKVKVKANFNFTIELPEDVDWLEMEKFNYKFDDRVARPREIELKFKYDINFKEEARSTMITFKPVNTSIAIADKADLNITQLSADKIEIGVKGDSLAILAVSRSLGLMTEWDTSEKLENWNGVTVWKTKDERNGRVRSLHLAIFRTTEPIPYQIKYLTELEELSFYGNANTFLIKNLDCGQHVCELTKLRKLTIGAYGLTSLHKDFTKLSNLEYLNLEANNFQKIPDIINENNFPKLTALILNANKRYSISDLSNDVRTNVGGFIDEEGFPIRFLTWNKLDTLRFSANYLQGTLPSDEQMLEIVGSTWTTAELKDSLATGSTFFDENKIPKVMPETDFFAINLNRLYGELPKWLLYHPKLDLWYPDLLVWSQEGVARNGTKAGFSNAPTNMTYYYDELYVNKKYNPKNYTEE